MAKNQNNKPASVEAGMAQASTEQTSNPEATENPGPAKQGDLPVSQGAGEKIAVRILRDAPVEGVRYKPNQVVRVSGELAAELEKSGAADSSEAGVQYCLEHEKAEVLEHCAQAAEVAESAPSENDEGEIVE